MSGYIVTEELAEQMRQMKTDGMTCRQIAQVMGVSKSTVSAHIRANKRRKKTPRDELRELLRTVSCFEKQHDALYDVKIYLIQKRPDEVIYERLDHRPTYSDMMLICKRNGLNAVDFEDDYGTKMDDRVYHGTVYMPRSRSFPLARFTICRLKGDVYIEDFFR